MFNSPFKDYVLATKSLLPYKSIIIKATDKTDISSVSRIFHETKQYKNTKILLFELQLGRVSKHRRCYKTWKKRTRDENLAKPKTQDREEKKRKFICQFLQTFLVPVS